MKDREPRRQKTLFRFAATLIGVSNLALIACSGGSYPSAEASPTPVKTPVGRTDYLPSLTDLEKEVQQVRLRYPECVAGSPDVELKKMLDRSDQYRVRIVQPESLDAANFSIVRAGVVDNLETMGRGIAIQNLSKRALVEEIASAHSDVAQVLLIVAQVLPGDLSAEIKKLAACRLATVITLTLDSVKEDLSTPQAPRSPRNTV